MQTIRDDAMFIINESIKAVLPEAAVVKALNQKDFGSNIVLVAIGKAAWNMANAAKEALGSKVRKGIVVTKYGHSKGHIEHCEIIEAGHPVPDKNSVLGAEKILAMVSGLTTDDQVIFLVSGGGSALFEKPLDGVSLEDVIDITSQLLSCGAAIVEINTIRKHLSAVKGGRFAQQCGGAKIYSIVLSDVVGDRLDAIASGPAYPDSSTSEEAFCILEKYKIRIRDHLAEALGRETPKIIENCETVVTGSVTALCEAAAISAQKLGYSPLVASTSIDRVAKEYGTYLATLVHEINSGNYSETAIKPPCAIISGGETIVRLSGNGKGGRNQEVALAAALGIEGIDHVVVFSVGSDGTDGPTDAAGGMVDGGTVSRMRASSVSPEVSLANNDSYHALKSSGDLIVTGPTGTNVNDLMVILCK
ncbi:MAG: glycerate kinase [Prolixibacteraceae bacterium]|jgi:hydroxypyruvate reductase